MIENNRQNVTSKTQTSSRNLQSTTKSTTSRSATKPTSTISKTSSSANKTLNASSSTSKTSTASKLSSSSKSTGNKKPNKSNNNKKRNIIFIILAICAVIAIIVGVVLATSNKGSGNNNNNNGNNDNNNPSQIVIPTPPNQGTYNRGDLKPGDAYENVTIGEETFYNKDEIVDYPYDITVSSTTMVGISDKQIGEVERDIPQTTRDEGLGVYPKYGYTLSTVIGSTDDKVAARNALIAESNYLCATGTYNNSGNGGSYSWMDENGYLYNGTTSAPSPSLDKLGNHRRLYKHSASVGLYLGDVSDDEPGIIKEVTIRPRGYTSYSVTGVYAPAGEIIKIQISEKDMNATGGITVHIGQALYNGQANNIWTAKGQMQRFPVILNTMIVNKNTATLNDGVYTAYVGSFLGGPLYIRNTAKTFTATISGGVTYSHFILGKTTKEEFEANAKSSAPYFDLEVWNYGVLHSGPKAYAKNFSYENIYKAAILWEKVSSVTTTGSSQGIVFLYDPFVAAGAAVAFPGRSSVNCPTGWMANSLNYNGIVTSGAWGNFHEYHHNFQGYGVGNGGEVTNNGMSLVSYALFTKISSARGISSYGAAGLGGWNSYTSATWALQEVLKIPNGGTPSNGMQGLALYATLLHNFGANNYIQSKVQQQRHSYGQTYSGYLRAWQDITHNDMTYYFKDILKGITEEVAEKWRNPEYPTFVPVSSVYQTGRSYMYDGVKQTFKTMQPYVIPYGKPFTIDLNKYLAPSGQYASGSIVIPDGFTYTIKNVSSPKSGNIQKIDDYQYLYTPGEDTFSGEIVATLQITKTDGAFTVDDVDLILEFEQTHETNKMVLTRTTYTYTTDNMYTDAQTAYENNFAGFETTNISDHINPTQNCNTDIWFYPNTDANHEKYPNAPDSYFVHDNNIATVDGKVHFNEAGKYRFYLRGRMNCAVYYSIDGGETYNLGATIKDVSLPSNSSAFRLNDPNTYFDVELEDDSWVYFKSILIVQSSPMVSYIGLGYSKWQEPMFTIVTKYYDKDGNEVSSAEEAVRTETHYYDYRGNEVTEEEANRAELIPPTSTPAYLNAYNVEYQFPTNTTFETDYFYTREYYYTYSEDEKVLSANQTHVESIYSPWDNTPTYSINNLFDNDDETFIHNNRTPISQSNPFSVTAKLDQTLTANRLTFHGSQVNNGRYSTYMPKDFKIWVKEGEDSEWTLVCDRTNVSYSNHKTIANFDRYYTFNYYKVEITATHARQNLGYLCLNKIEFSSIFSLANGKQYSPDNQMFTYNGSWSGMQTNSSFGHVYIGKAGATMEFEFTGKRLALLSSASYGKNFEVYIDGVKVNSIDVKEDDNAYSVSYISSELSSSTHRVEIRCLGDASIDSVVVYQ